jgi:hypothetical protein
MTFSEVLYKIKCESGVADWDKDYTQPKHISEYDIDELIFVSNAFSVDGGIYEKKFKLTSKCWEINISKFEKYKEVRFSPKIERAPCTPPMLFIEVICDSNAIQHFDIDVSAYRSGELLIRL